MVETSLVDDVGKSSSFRRPTNSRDLFALAIGFFVFVLVIWIRIRFLDVSLGRNEGAYGYLGSQVLRGAVPFTDFYEMKPAGLYYTYALFVAVFGGKAAGLHTGLLLLNIATTGLVFAIANRIFGLRPALLAAVTYGFLSVHPPAMGLALEVEHIINFAVGLSLWLVLCGNAREGAAWFVFAGICIGWAASLKHSAGLSIVSALLFCLLDWDVHRDRALVWKRAACVTAGSVLVVALVIAYHVALGNVADALYWMIEFPATQYGVNVSLAQGVEFFSRRFDTVVWPHGWVYTIALLGVAAWGTRRDMAGGQARILLACMLVAFALVVPGLRFYGHYWLLFMLPVSLAIGFVASRLSIGFRGSTCLALYLLSMPVSILLSRWDFLSLSPVEMNQRVYRFNPFPEIDRISEMIRDRIGPDDQVVVFGSEPQAYLTLGIEAPSRHVYLSFLTRPHPRQADAVREFRTAIVGARPRFAVFVNDGRSWTFRAEDSQDLFIWTQRYLQESYRPLVVADIVPFSDTRWVSWPESATYRPRARRSVVLYERVEREEAPHTVPSDNL